MRALRQAELAHTFRVRHAGMFATGKNLRTSDVFFFFFFNNTVCYSWQFTYRFSSGWDLCWLEDGGQSTASIIR